MCELNFQICGELKFARANYYANCNASFCLVKLILHVVFAKVCSYGYRIMLKYYVKFRLNTHMLLFCMVPGRSSIGPSSGMTNLPFFAAYNYCYPVEGKRGR